MRSVCWRCVIIGIDDLSGSCRQGEGAADNVEHVERPDSISWECDTQQDAPRPRGAPCPSRFHPCLLSRSGKSRRHGTHKPLGTIFSAACHSISRSHELFGRDDETPATARTREERKIARKPSSPETVSPWRNRDGGPGARVKPLFAGARQRAIGCLVVSGIC